MFKVVMTLVITCLLVETLGENRSKEKLSPSRYQSSRLNPYLQPPPMPTREKISRPTQSNRQQITKLKNIKAPTSTPEKSESNNKKPNSPEQKYRIERWFFAAEDDPEVKRFIPSSRHGLPQKHQTTRLSHSLKTTHLSPAGPHKSRAIFPHRSRHPPQHLVKGGNAKSKDCNPCNKVPWIPMSRTPAGISDQVLSLVMPPVLEHPGSESYSGDHHEIAASGISADIGTTAHESQPHGGQHDDHSDHGTGHHDLSLPSASESLSSHYDESRPPSAIDSEVQPSIEINLGPSSTSHSSSDSHYGPSSAESNHPPPSHSAPPVPSYDSPLPPPELPTHYDSHPVQNHENHLSSVSLNEIHLDSQSTHYEPEPHPEPGFIPSVQGSPSSGPSAPFSHPSPSPPSVQLSTASQNVPVQSIHTFRRPPQSRPYKPVKFSHPPPPPPVPPGKYRTPLSFFPTKESSINLGNFLQPPPPPPGPTVHISFPKRPHSLFDTGSKIPQQNVNKLKKPAGITYLPVPSPTRPRPFSIPNQPPSAPVTGILTLSPYLVPPTYFPGNFIFTTLQGHQPHFDEAVSNINIDLPAGSENVEVMPSSPSTNFETQNQNNPNHHTQPDSYSEEENSASSSDDQLHLPSGDNHNAEGNDNSNLPVQSALQRPKNNGTEVEFVKSVQIADYVSSVEYPFEIVQSPYVDISQSSESVEHHGDSTANHLHTKPSSHNNNHINFPNDENSQKYNNYQSQTPFQIYFNNTSDASHVDYINNNNNNFVSNNSQTYDQLQQQLVNSNENEVYNVHPVYNGSVDSYDSNSQESAFTIPGPLPYPGEDDHHSDSARKNNTISSDHKYTSNIEFQPSIQTAVGASLASQQSPSDQDSTLIHQINNLELYKQVLQSQPGLLEGLKQVHPHSVMEQLPFPLAFPSQPGQGQHIPLPTPFHVKSKPFKRPYAQPFNFIGVIQHPPAPVSSVATLTNTFQPDQPSTYLSPPAYDPVTLSPWTPGTVPAPLVPTLVPTTPIPPLRAHDSHAVGSFDNAGLVPPPMAINGHSLANKKNKQIQIIVPYTSNNVVNPLHIETTGWSPMTSFASDLTLNLDKNVPLSENCSKTRVEEIHRFTPCNNNIPSWLHQPKDYHQPEESKTVTATVVASDASSTKHRDNFKQASSFQDQHTEEPPSSIRDVLKGEEFIKNAPDSLSLLRLQKNIDEWTALEYSKSDNITDRSVEKGDETATVPAVVLPHHILVPSKNIPEAYLTTPLSVFDDITGNESIATSIPHKKVNAAGKYNESSGSVRYIVKSSAETKNKTSFSHQNSVKIKKIITKPPDNLRETLIWNILETTNITPETTDGETTYQSTTDVTTEATTFDENTEQDELTSLPNWDELEVSISSITKEKVYVVTPVSSWTQQWTTPSPPPNHASSDRLSTTPTPVAISTHSRTISTSINDVFPFRNGLYESSEKKRDLPETNYSPRFAVRPTPGTNTQRSFSVLSIDDEPHLTTLYPVDDNEIEHSRVEKSANSTILSSTESSAWGLTDLPTYTPPPGTRVHTYSGHSRVVTAPTVLNVRKKLYGSETKKQTTSKTSTSTTSRPRPIGILRKYRPDRHSYLWHFPELLTPGTVREEENDDVKNAVVELKKKTS